MYLKLLPCILFVLLTWDAFTQQITPIDYVQAQCPPTLSNDHGLLPISLAPGFTPAFPYEVRVELADKWGYGLLFGRITAANVDKALNDPNSVYYKVLELAKSDPDRYPLDVYLNTQNYFKAQGQTVSASATPEAYLRDASGNVIFSGGSPVASPEIPDHLWDGVIANLTDPLKTLAAQGIKFNTIQNWSEWFFPVFGWGSQQYQQDPTVVAAKEAMVGPGNDLIAGSPHPSYRPWNKYLHTRRAYYENRLADTVKMIAPNRNSYNWYALSGGSNYGRYGDYDNWQYFQFNVAGADTIADYPGESLYIPDNGRIMNNGNYSNQINDLLSRATAAKGEEVKGGAPLSQHWVWVKETQFHNFEAYKGYLKSLYVLGQIGHLQYLEPESGTNYNYDVSFDSLSPPTWLQLTLELARVYAEVTHVDDFILEGDLQEGPYEHIYWAQRHVGRNPGYVLDNPYELFQFTGQWDPPSPNGTPNGEVRVVARQKPSGELLLCVWAADGVQRTVDVTLPDGTIVPLEATITGKLYTGFSNNLQEVVSETGVDCGGPNCPPCSIFLAPKVFVQGAMDGMTMTNNIANILPSNEPYTSLGYTHVGDGGGETISSISLRESGNIVDWVVVELRDKDTPSIIRATRSALLTKNGDVVSHNDGTSPVAFGIEAGEYYVSIRHRNHLGMMTSAPVMID